MSGTNDQAGAGAGVGAGADAPAIAGPGGRADAGAQAGASKSGIDGLVDDIARQRAYLAARVPAYDRILAHVAADLGGDIGRRLDKAWARRRFVIFYERPLLLLAAMRHDALCSGPEGHPLWPALAAEVPDPDAATAEAVARALGREPERARVWHSLTRRTVQTNEVSRAVAWLWPAALVEAAARTAGREPPALALVDLGCSAGLNLVADGIDLSWTDGDGKPLAVARSPRIARRVGLDRSPLDPAGDDDATWLRACVWAGERARLERLEQAIAAFRAARASGGAAAPVLEAVVAEDMPARVAELTGASTGDAGATSAGASGAGAPGETPPVWLFYQTVMREYLGPAREPYLAGMKQVLAALPPGRAVWIELEAPAHGATRRTPAALTLHLRRPEGTVHQAILARCEYHPTELVPDPDGVALLVEAVSAG